MSIKNQGIMFQDRISILRDMLSNKQSIIDHKGDSVRSIKHVDHTEHKIIYVSWNYETRRANEDNLRLWKRRR